MDADWWYRRVVLPAGGLGLLAGLASLLLLGAGYRARYVADGEADGGEAVDD